jgi:hypothetical protein
MLSIDRLPTALIVAALLAACAGNPQPGDPGYRFNVAGEYAASFVVEGNPYGGRMTLTTASGGAVSGNLTVTSPFTMESTLSGTIAADSLRLTLPYATPQNCFGTASLVGAIAEGGVGAAGTMSLDDSCDGALTGTFTLSR